MLKKVIGNTCLAKRDYCNAEKLGDNSEQTCLRAENMKQKDAPVLLSRQLAWSTFLSNKSAHYTG